jgi:hypothetical protein
MSEQPDPTDPEPTEVVPPAEEPAQAAAPPPPPPPPPPPSPQPQHAQPGAYQPPPTPPSPTPTPQAAGYGPGWGTGWARRGPYPRRGIALLIAGLIGLVVGCMLGVGVTAVAAHVIGVHDRSSGVRGPGWYGPPGERQPRMKPNFPGGPRVVPKQVPSAPQPS